MRVKTDRGAEYTTNLFDVVGSSAIAIVLSNKTISEVATDFDNVSVFSVFNPDDDVLKTYEGYKNLLSIVKQTSSSYFITLERGDD